MLHVNFGANFSAGERRRNGVGIRQEALSATARVNDQTEKATFTQARASVCARLSLKADQLL